MHSVFITGASSGLGAALALQYARQGAHLGLLARRGDTLQQLIASLPHPERHRAYAVDVCDHAALKSAAQDFIGHAGHIDVVIASAGVSYGTLSEHAEDLDAFARLIAINVTATVATFAPFIAAMKSQGSGRLVGIGSVAGIRGLPGAEAYSASKSAVITYLESLRLELRASGIKVITIAPGYIATPMTAINPYRMPFLLAPDEAARRFARVIERGCSYTVIPWQMGVVAKLLRLLPNWLYDRLFAKAPRKPKVL